MILQKRTYQYGSLRYLAYRSISWRGEIFGSSKSRLYRDHRLYTFNNVVRTEPEAVAALRGAKVQGCRDGETKKKVGQQDQTLILAGILVAVALSSNDQLQDCSSLVAVVYKSVNSLPGA